MKTWILTLAGVLTSLACYANPSRPALTISVDDHSLIAIHPEGLPSPLPGDDQPNQPPQQPPPSGPNYGKTYQYDFGQVPINSSRWVRFTLRSNGPGPLYVNQVALYGQGFFGRTSCPYILYPGQICEAVVEFRPWCQGGCGGQLIFNTSAGQFVVYLGAFVGNPDVYLRRRTIFCKKL